MEVVDRYVSRLRPGQMCVDPICLQSRTVLLSDGLVVPRVYSREAAFGPCVDELGVGPEEVVEHRACDDVSLQRRGTAEVLVADVFAQREDLAGPVLRLPDGGREVVLVTEGREDHPQERLEFQPRRTGFVAQPASQFIAPGVREIFVDGDRVALDVRPGVTPTVGRT